MFKQTELINLCKQSDERLVVLALKNNQEALEILISRYLKIIYNFIYQGLANREEAEDLTQEVFVKVWKNLDKFNTSKIFRPWLYQIAKNTCLDYYRKKQPSSFASLAQKALDKIQPLNQVWSLVGDSQEDLVDKNLLQEKFKAALVNLEIQSSDIVTMHYESNLSFKSIAEIKNQPLNTIKSRYRRALSKIKKEMF